MKYFTILVFLLFSFSTFAKKKDILAIVNNKPITSYEVSEKKKIINIFGLNSFNSSKKKCLLELLIEEEILNQYAEKMGIEIPEEAVDKFLFAIEDKKKMPKGWLIRNVRDLGISAKMFKKQIRTKILENILIADFLDSISITSKEIDLALINNNYEKISVKGWIFTSLYNTKKSMCKMKKLQNNLTSCDTIRSELYADFATLKKIDSKLNYFSTNTRSAILNTNENNPTIIYQEDDKLKMFFLCSKKILVSKNKNKISRIENFLLNKKISKKFQEFFKDRRSEFYIKYF